MPTVKELKAEAKALGLKGYSKLRKAELIKAIEKAKSKSKSKSKSKLLIDLALAQLVADCKALNLVYDKKTGKCRSKKSQKSKKKSKGSGCNNLRKTDCKARKGCEWIVGKGCREKVDAPEVDAPEVDYAELMRKYIAGETARKTINKLKI